MGGGGAFLAFSWSKSVYSGGLVFTQWFDFGFESETSVSLCVLEKLSHGFHWSYVKFNS